MEQSVNISKDRIGILIGEKGKNKKKIEEIGNVKIKVHNSGKVEVSGESLNVFNAINVIEAIGRGFSPKVAIKLFEEGYVLEIIQMPKKISKHKNQLERVRGRVIGRKGRFKKEVEYLCDVNISVKGKTVSIIGLRENVEVAKEVINMIIYGAKHTTAENVLAKKRRWA